MAEVPSLKQYINRLAPSPRPVQALATLVSTEFDNYTFAANGLTPQEAQAQVEKMFARMDAYNPEVDGDEATFMNALLDEFVRPHVYGYEVLLNNMAFNIKRLSDKVEALENPSDGL